MPKLPPEFDGDTKTATNIAKAFDGIGGLPKFIAWARNHRSSFYSMYVKLLPLQAQVNTNVNVDVNVHDGEEARAKLMDLSLIHI